MEKIEVGKCLKLLNKSSSPPKIGYVHLGTFIIFQMILQKPAHLNKLYEIIASN